MTKMALLSSIVTPYFFIKPYKHGYGIYTHLPESNSPTPTPNHRNSGRRKSNVHL